MAKERKKKGVIKVIILPSTLDPTFSMALLKHNGDYLVDRILSYRKKLVKDPHFTEKDIHDYDKHFGIM